jgi:protein-disulfide isomerase
MRTRVTCTALGLSLAAASVTVAQLQRETVAGEIVATIGDQRVTAHQLEELARDRLMRLRAEEYNIKRQVLDEYVTRTLLEKEARARGIGVEELQKREVDDKVVPISEEQKRAVFESNRQQFQGKSEAEAFAQIEANLKRVRIAEARRQLLAATRASTPVRILLEAPRLEVAAEGPALGPKDAAVTIVEFADYQCPACARALPTVKRLMQQYQGKVRFVFQDFPLQIHPDAPKAAEAAACAGEQGKFWEMHDTLFSNQQGLKPADLKRRAAALELEANRFDSCLDSGKRAADWKRQLEAGRNRGVSATPTFFINGRLLSGAQPYQNFADVIEQELARGTAASSR